MNDRIFTRQIGSNPSIVPLSQIPASTRREVNRSETPNHTLKHQQVNRLYPATGTVEPSYMDYASNISDESKVRATDAPLTKCLLKSSYQPTSNSDMYNNWTQPPPPAASQYDKAQELRLDLFPVMKPRAHTRQSSTITHASRPKTKRRSTYNIFQSSCIDAETLWYTVWLTRCIIIIIVHKSR